MYKCMICDREVKDTDDYEWHGYDGDKIHKNCKPKCNEIYNAIDNMSDEEFVSYLRDGNINS